MSPPLWPRSRHTAPVAEQSKGTRTRPGLARRPSSRAVSNSAPASATAASSPAALASLASHAALNSSPCSVTPTCLGRGLALELQSNIYEVFVGAFSVIVRLKL